MRGTAFYASGPSAPLMPAVTTKKLWTRDKRARRERQRERSGRRRNLQATGRSDPPGWREWYGPPGGPRGRPLAGMWAALIGPEALKGPRRESHRGLRLCQVLSCCAIPYPTPVFSRVQLCRAVPRRGVLCLTVPRCLALCHALSAVSH